MKAGEAHDDSGSPTKKALILEADLLRLRFASQILFCARRSFRLVAAV